RGAVGGRLRALRRRAAGAGRDRRAGQVDGWRPERCAFECRGVVCGWSSGLAALHPARRVRRNQGAGGAGGRRPRAHQALAVEAGAGQDMAATPGPAAGAARGHRGRDRAIERVLAGKAGRDMNHIIQQIEAERATRQVPEFKPGDTIVVSVKVKEGDRERLQAYEGVVIARSNRGYNSSVTVRKISHGEGVERVFQLHSPTIEGIAVKRRGNVRRAKLYYLRNLSGKAARIEEKV